MDSLTQITLGAACGEIALGRKIGNRAMVWGAVAGTIPDLDVLANFAADPITAMALHRGITHSLFFAVVAPLLFALAVQRLYNSGVYIKPWFRRLNLFFWPLVVFGLGILAMTQTDAISGELLQTLEPAVSEEQTSALSQVLSAAIPGFIVLVLLWLFYYRKPKPICAYPSYPEWVNLFFWAIFTHPLLDCCTAYGTQLFQPFSDFRVSLDNISVVDPLYTLPFLLLILVAARRAKKDKLRRYLVIAGIAISSLYILYTFYNKWQVNKVFERSFAAKQLEYSRLITTPTIFNNFLWQGIAESDSFYYQGYYSVFDDEKVVEPIRSLPKNRHLLAGHKSDKDIQTLIWFTNGYYNLVERPDGYVQFNHLRFGLKSDKVVDYLSYTFKWILVENPNTGEWTARQAPEMRDVSADEFRDFRNRVFGVVSDE